jgi:hypothetical protein
MGRDGKRVFHAEDRGPEAQMNWIKSKNRKKASVAKVWQERGRAVGDEAGGSS